MSPQTLRELAVTVREHGPVSYYWVLIERTSAGDWEEVSVSNDYLYSRAVMGMEGEWPDVRPTTSY